MPTGQDPARLKLQVVKKKEPKGFPAPRLATAYKNWCNCGKGGEGTSQPGNLAWQSHLLGTGFGNKKDARLRCLADSSSVLLESHLG